MRIGTSTPQAQALGTLIVATDDLCDSSMLTNLCSTWRGYMKRNLSKVQENCMFFEIIGLCFGVIALSI